MRGIGCQKDKGAAGLSGRALQQREGQAHGQPGSAGTPGTPDTGESAADAAGRGQ